MIAQKPEMEALLAELLASPRRKIDQSPEAQLRRLRDYYIRLAQVGEFPAPAADADSEALKNYRAQYLEQIEDASILDEIRQISSGELFSKPPRDRSAFPTPVYLRDVRNPKPCLAKQAEEMLERRRSFLAEWSREFGYEAPPQTGEWEELQEYEERNSAEIERADLMSEVKRILAADA